MPKFNFPFHFVLDGEKQQFFCVYKLLLQTPEFRSFSQSYENVSFNFISVYFNVFSTDDNQVNLRVSYLNKLPEEPDYNVYPYNYVISKYRSTEIRYNFFYDFIQMGIKYKYDDFVSLQDYVSGIPKDNTFYLNGKWPNFTMYSDKQLSIDCIITFDINNSKQRTSGVRFQNLVLEGNARPEDVVAPATFYSNDSNDKQIGIIKKEEDYYEAPPGWSEYTPSPNTMITKLSIKAPSADVKPVDDVVAPEQVPFGQTYSDVKPEYTESKKGTMQTIQQVIGKAKPFLPYLQKMARYIAVPNTINSSEDPDINLLLKDQLKVCVSDIKDENQGELEGIDLDKIKGIIQQIKPVLEGTKAEMTYTKNGDYNFKPSINRVYTGVTIHVKTESFPWKFDRARGKLIDHAGGLPILGTPFLFSASIKLLWKQKVINVMPGASVMFAVRPEGHKRIRVTISNKIETELDASIAHPTAVMWIPMPGSGETDKPSAIEIGSKETFGEENNILNPEKGMMFMIPFVLTTYEVFLSRDMFKVEGLGWG